MRGLGQDLAAHRVPRDDLVWKIGARHGDGTRAGEAADQAVRRAGAGVLFGDDQRNTPNHRGERGGDARVAAQRQHGARPQSAHHQHRVAHGMAKHGQSWINVPMCT